MIKADLRKLSKSQLIKLLLKQNVESTPKPSIKQMMKQSGVISADHKPVSKIIKVLSEQTRELTDDLHDFLDYV